MQRIRRMQAKAARYDPAPDSVTSALGPPSPPQSSSAASSPQSSNVSARTQRATRRQASISSGTRSPVARESPLRQATPKRRRKNVRIHSTSRLKYLIELSAMQTESQKKSVPLSVLVASADHLRKINDHRSSSFPPDQDIELVEISMNQTSLGKSDYQVHKRGIKLTGIGMIGYLTTATIGMKK